MEIFKTFFIFFILVNDNDFFEAAKRLIAVWPGLQQSVDYWAIDK